MYCTAFSLDAAKKRFVLSRNPYCHRHWGRNMAAALARRVSGVYLQFDMHTFSFTILSMIICIVLTTLCNFGLSTYYLFLFYILVGSTWGLSRCDFLLLLLTCFHVCPCVSQGCWGRCLCPYAPGHQRSVSSPVSSSRSLSTALLRPLSALLCGL